MRWVLPAFSIVALTAITGCGHLQQAKLVRPQIPVNSVVSLSPSTTEIVASSTISMKLKGRTASDNYPRSVASVPIVASVKPDYEAIKVMNPNVILLDGQLYNSGDMAKIKEVCPNVFVVDAKTIGEFENQMFALGDMLGFQTNQEDYVDRIEVAMNTAKASKPSVPIKVAVILPGHGGAAMIDGSKSFISDVIEEDGGVSVGPPNDRFTPLNAESLAAASPDLIILPTTTANASADVAAILADPALKGTKAVQGRKIAAIDEDVALRRGARVDKLIENIHKAFSTVTAKA